jgi:hypothetical protein
MFQASKVATVTLFVIRSTVLGGVKCLEHTESDGDMFAHLDGGH